MSCELCKVSYFICEDLPPNKYACIMTALKPTDIDDLTAFGAGTHLLKTLILELLLVWGGITKRKK